MKDHHKLRCFINTAAGDKLIYQKDDSLFYTEDNSDQGVGIDQGELIELGNIYFDICSGSKIKNGKLIYEGDILKCDHFIDRSNKKNHLYHIVEWSNKYSGWYAKNKDEDNKGSGSVQLFVYLNCAKNIEIIGNIHQNKELLENT